MFQRLHVHIAAYPDQMHHSKKIHFKQRCIVDLENYRIISLENASYLKAVHANLIITNQL